MPHKIKRFRKGHTVRSLLFFHIPLQEFQTAYDLYRAGSPDVTYFYGSIGEANKKIACSDHPSTLFDTAVRLGSTQAMFVGHDHLNTLSVAYKGIRLTYGLSIDYLAYPGIGPADCAARRDMHYRSSRRLH